ncbi:MAG: hypothetical protein OCD02_15300 [Spirochaetaceae bacterium]
MKRIITLLVITLLSISSIISIDQKQFDRLDELFKLDMDKDGYALVKQTLPKAKTDLEKAEVLWRYSQFTHEMATIIKKEGADKNIVLDKFMEGHKLATDSIKLNPKSPWGYYWRAANIGSWGSTKGIIDSVGKIGEMKDDLAIAVEIDPKHGDSWSVLALLSADVPGVLGGSMDRAVSLDRKAASVWNGKDDLPIEWFTEMANHMYKRDWSVKKRNSSLSKKSKKFKKEKSLVDKNEYYEGTLDFSKKALYTDTPLNKLSDKEESKQVYIWMVKQLEKIPNRSKYLTKRLEGFKNTIKDRDWT